MPRIVGMSFKNDTGHLDRVELEASPLGTERGKGSKLVISVDGFESLKVRAEQIEGAPESWKPGEVCLDGIASVRALRDACNRFLDRFHDEVDRG